MQSFISSSIACIFLAFFCLVGCEKVAKANEVKSFCNNIKIGSNHELMEQSLSALGMEIRTRAPEADATLRSLLEDPDSMDGILVTSRGLPHSEAAPACMIYFSSNLYSGNGKIVHKQFITSAPKGI